MLTAVPIPIRIAIAVPGLKLHLDHVSHMLWHALDQKFQHGFGLEQSLSNPGTDYLRNFACKVEIQRSDFKLTQTEITRTPMAE